MILLHAIAEDGPFVQNEDETGYPIDDLAWNKDSPHPKKQEDGKLRAELLWVTQSH